MIAVVPVKRVVDFNVRIRVKADGSGVELANLKMAMNPFDEIALEEALRQREAGKVTEVVVVSVAPDAAQETLRNGLALGADRGIHIRYDDPIEPLNVAKLLRAVVHKLGASLVILGKQAIDDDSNQTGQMLAALLGWGQGTFASHLAIEGGVAHVTREVDGGLQKIAIDLPAIITADLRLNTPRYASLPNIMKAKKKPLEVVTPADFGVEVKQRLQVIATEQPAARRSGVILKSASELVDKLRHEAGVL